MRSLLEAEHQNSEVGKLRPEDTTVEILPESEVWIESLPILVADLVGSVPSRGRMVC